MKRIFYLFAASILLMQSCGQGPKNKAAENNISEDNNSLTKSGTIIINGSEVLFPLVMTWKMEFQKQYPKIVIENLATSSDNSMKQLKSGSINLAMVSRKLTDGEVKEGLYAVPVALDAVLPVISFDNDNIQTIVQKGITIKKLAGIFNGSIKTWGQLLANKSTEPIETYILPDTSGTSHSWADFLGIKVKMLRGKCLYNNQAVASIVATKKGGIGYCSMSRIYEPKYSQRRGNIMVCPIDLNNSGIADDKEQIFDKLDDLRTAITKGKYPSPPVRYLYLVTKGQPKDLALRSFLSWIISIGQNYCSQTGLVNIDKATADKFTKELK
jgi:phosphate transport system substrate-binding protein